MPSKLSQTYMEFCTLVDHFEWFRSIYSAFDKVPEIFVKTLKIMYNSIHVLALESSSLKTSLTDVGGFDAFALFYG